MTEPSTPLPANEGPRIVGIGASAGGLEALEQFFAHIPSDSGLSYVVVQHTSPEHKSLLGSLLQQVTTVPVRDAHNGVVLAPDHIYVMPTGGQLRVERGCLRFKPAHKTSSSPEAIDVFLTSMAQDQGERAVGVVLSGMGHDGTAGLKALHNAAGFCLAQQPDTAAFAAMPAWAQGHSMHGGSHSRGGPLIPAGFDEVRGDSHGRLRKTT